MQTLLKTITRMLLITFLLVSAGIIVLAIVLWISSPGKPRPYQNEKGQLIPNSISEKGFIDIQGGMLGYFIKGKNINNPILLYLHGGMPDYFLTQTYPTGLDELFTIVWWEQRGAGMSFNARNQAKNVSLDDLIQDTKAMTDYLRKRFSQDRIYLMAHSGGFFLGIKVIEKYPELYTAYLGVAQISYQKLSEKLACDYIIGQYKNDVRKQKMVADLRRHPICLNEPLPEQYLKIRDTAMHDLGIGTMRNMKDVITGLFIPSLFFKEYSLREKLNLWRGKASSGISIIWNEMITRDLAVENTTFEIPVYFLEGRYDFTCSYSLAQAYYEKINAPVKGFYTFQNSAHSPIFEEPEACVRIIKENIIRKQGTN